MTKAASLPLARGTLDRASALRTDPDRIKQLWRDPSTRVLRVHGGEALVAGDPQALVFVGPDDVDADEGYFLGLDEQQVAYFAVDAAVSADAPVDAGGPSGAEQDRQVGGLRTLGSVLGDRDVGLLVHAIALTNWHAAHSHCARCGAPTEAVPGGHLRRCLVDGSEHFPRTDPAVIMLVSDHAGRALLGRQPSWPQRRFSTLAGFVEPGESAEHAVIREVHEETGVEVDDVAYFASQPWPFPSSLMLGFRATARTTAIRLDDELAEARWFTRDELYSSVRRREVLLPPPVSIARRLIENWYGAELPVPPPS